MDPEDIDSFIKRLEKVLEKSRCTASKLETTLGKYYTA